MYIYIYINVYTHVYGYILIGDGEERERGKERSEMTRKTLTSSTPLKREIIDYFWKGEKRQAD